MDDAHIVLLCAMVGFGIALAGLVVSLIYHWPPCICGHANKEHAEIMTKAGRFPHAGMCKTCTCRVYIAS